MYVQNTVYLCLDYNCRMQLLIRNLDEHSKHQREYHQMSDIKCFKEKYGHLASQTVKDKYQEVQRELQLEKSKVVKLIDNLLDKMINELFRIDEELLRLLQIIESGNTSELLSNQRRLQKIWLEGPAVLSYDIDATKTLLKQSLNKLDRSISGILDDVKKFLEDPNSQAQSRFNNQNGQQQINQDQDLSTFSQIFKHRQIKLISSNHIKGDNFQISAICLTNKALTINSQPVEKFGFVMTKSSQSKMVAFGICHVDTVKMKDWVWDRKLGSGAYMIRENGKIYSHWDEGTNDKSDSFEFIINTPIYCYLTGQQVRFLNSETGETSQLRIKQTQEKLYPCVAITSDDEVKILEQESIPNFEDNILYFN